jgi:hypothetical protein
MHLTYPAGFSDITYHSDAEGFTVRGRFTSCSIPWEAVTAGGVLWQNDAAIAAATPLRSLPVMGYLIRKNEEMNRSTQRVWIAWKRSFGRKAVDSVPIPRTPEGDAMLQELRSHCVQWSDEPQQMISVRRAHGLSNTYAIALTLAFIPIVGVVLLLILLGVAFVIAGFQWLVIKFWWIAVFVIGFYWVYRKLHSPLE